MNDTDLTSAYIGYSAQMAGAAMDMAMQYSSQEWKEKEAKKVREWNEEMYQRQLEDNRENWRMMNEYNLPSAALARLRDAGLNPLLYYNNGNSGVVAADSARGANFGSAPAASGDMHTNFGQALAGAALLRAQIANMNADTRQKNAEADLKGEQKFGQTIQNEVDWRTRDAKVAIQNKNVQKIDQDIEWLATQDFALTNITAANLDNIASMIEFRKKYYDLDYAKTENQIWYNIEQIALGKAHVNNELKELAIKFYSAQTDRKRVNGELQVFAAQVQEINSRKDLTDAQKADEYLKAYNQVLKNEMLENIGTDNLGGAAGLLLLLTGKTFGRIE